MSKLLLTPRHPNPVAKAIGVACIQMARLPVPRIIGHADASAFVSRGELLKSLAKIFDGIYSAIGEEGAAHSNAITAGDFATFISDMVHDHSLAAQFDEAAEEETEARRDMSGNQGTAAARWGNP